MKLGIAADHGGYELKGVMYSFLKNLGYELVDFGAYELNTKDDYFKQVIIYTTKLSENKALQFNIKYSLNNF